MNNFAEENLRGIKGWLIFVAIGIVLTPLIMIRQIYLDYHELLNNGVWYALSTPGLDTYVPAWKTLVWVERLINCGTVLVWSYVGSLFFKEKKSFPIWYIGIIVFHLVFLFVDSLALKAIFPDQTVFVPETTDQIIRSFVAALIWVPYMRVSERVKATFVN